jgi:hypothetical protein
MFLLIVIDETNQRNSDPRDENKMGVFGLHEQHLVGALFLTIVAFILGLIGFGTPYWYYKSETGCTRYGGLWHTCTTIGLSTLPLLAQSVPITTEVGGSNPTRCEVYSIQHYVIKFVSNLW